MCGMVVQLIKFKFMYQAIHNLFSGHAVGLQDLEGPSDNTQYLNSLIAHQGLLEVEPLHFTCISTSDGARVERAESPQGVPVPGLPTTGAAAAAALLPPAMLPTVSVSTEPDIEFLKVC